MFLPFQKQTTTTFEPTRDAIIRSKCVLFYGKRNTAFSHKIYDLVIVYYKICDNDTLKKFYIITYLYKVYTNERYRHT